LLDDCLVQALLISFLRLIMPSNPGRSALTQI
jgi:hypothetical protein